MRTYIFTDRERRIVQAFLDGKIHYNDRGFSQIRTRVKRPELVADLDLLLRVREAVATRTT